MIPFPDSLQRDGEGVFRLQVEAGHPAFQGHFPDQPILPGLVQIDWAIRLGAEAFGPLGTFKALEHLKFQATIQPLEALELRLAWNAETRELAFEYIGAAGLKSKGFAQFDAPTISPSMLGCERTAAWSRLTTGRRFPA